MQIKSSVAITFLNLRVDVLARNEKERASVERSIKTRDRRMLVVNKIHCAPGSDARRSVQELLTDPALPELIKQASKECGVNIVTAYSWLHRFWAGGSTANALLETFLNCGGRGKPKAQRNPLGRKPKIEAAIPPGEKRHTLTPGCKQKLSWGYLLIKTGVTERDAYLLTMAVHWADHVEDPVTGKVDATLFAKWRRPTFPQFKRWGKVGAGVSATELLLGRREYEQKTVARGGSEHDHVAGFGHGAEFDATSTDLYLVRTTSRLRKLPPMTRMILRETRLGIIYGLYCGWEHPSPATAALCILNGADPYKHLWAKWHFDLDIPEGAIPGCCRRPKTEPLLRAVPT